MATMLIHPARVVLLAAEPPAAPPLRVNAVCRVALHSLHEIALQHPATGRHRSCLCPARPGPQLTPSANPRAHGGHEREGAGIVRIVSLEGRVAFVVA